MSLCLDDLQSRIREFQCAANEILGDSEPFFYGDQFITGQITKPDFLFLGYNPGYGADWPVARQEQEPKAFTVSPCKFIEEFEDNRRLAMKIVEVLLDGDASKLHRCAETSLGSFFATPNASILHRQLNALAPSGLLQKHAELMKLAITWLREEVQPRQVVCVGLTTFNRYLDIIADGKQNIRMDSVPSISGKTERVFYKSTTISNTPVHGIIHLSGGRPSKIMCKKLRELFRTF